MLTQLIGGRSGAASSSTPALSQSAAVLNNIVPFQIVRADDHTAVMFYTNAGSTTVCGRVLNVSTAGVTIGAEQTLFSNGALSDSYTSADACAVADNAFMFLAYTNTSRVGAVSLSGGTLSAGPLVSTGALPSANWMPPSISICPLDTDKALLFMTGDSSSGNNSQVLVAVRNGTTINLGTPAQIGGGPRVGSLGAAQVAPNKALITYYKEGDSGKARIVTVSGTAVSLGTETAVGSNLNNYLFGAVPQMTNIGNSKVHLLYEPYKAVADCSGTTPTFSGETTDDNLYKSRGAGVFSAARNILGLTPNVAAPALDGMIFYDTSSTPTGVAASASGTLGTPMSATAYNIYLCRLSDSVGVFARGAVGPGGLFRFRSIIIP